MIYKILLVLSLLTVSIFSANDSLITAVITKYAPHYETTKGFNCMKTQTMILCDKETGADSSIMMIKAKVKSSFYDKPSEEVTYYEKNGETLDPEDFSSQKPQLPPYPLFDKESTTHYTFSYVGSIKRGAKNLEKYNFTPTKNENRYISGYVLIDKLNVTPVFISYEMVKTSFPMKSMSGTNELIDMNGALVPTKVSFNGHVHVPFLYPNKQVSGSITFSDYSIF